MKHYMFFFSILLLMVFTFIFESEELDSIILATTEWAPYYYIRDNVPSGPVLQIIEHIFNDIDIPVKSSFIPGQG